MKCTTRALSSTLVLALTLCSLGCEDDGTPSIRDAGADRTVLRDTLAHDATVDQMSDGWLDGRTDAPVIDLGPDALPPPTLPRGLTWVRDNPMFISAVTVNMGTPETGVVSDYFNGFHATAAHLHQGSLPSEVNGWKASNNSTFRYVAWTRDDGTSSENNQLIGGLAANALGRIGYQIGNEPGDAGDISNIDDGVNAVRAHDPNALLIVNFAHDVDDTLLQHFCLHMDADVLSYSHHTYGDAAYASLARFRKQALDCNRPYWRYLTAIVPSQNPPDAAKMRWDAFTGLVFGYSGQSWFLYQVDSANTQWTPALYNTKGDFTVTNKTALWSTAAQLNTEMRNFGKAITQLTSTDVRYVDFLGLPPSGLRSWSQGAGNTPYITNIAAAPGNPGLEILVGFFEDYRGEKVVMLQNADRSQDVGGIVVTFDFGTASGVSKDKVISLNKLNGQPEVKLLTSLGGSTAQLTVSLAGGDAFLFKFDNGVPFLLGN